ncbi:restriction endonuclease subunit S, partial [Mycoplasma zalophi]|uniref:restriction endonuclease subunit S n=1 Tax=Mycoplasma zalophi TaxID=191287 RepID=UPI0021CADCB4
FANVILQQVAEINIKVPDKKEQEKISNTFNLFDTSISLLKRKIEKMENIKQTLLNKMFVQ